MQAQVTMLIGVIIASVATVDLIDAVAIFIHFIIF